MPAPPGEFIESLISAPVTKVTRRVDIYEADAETIWMADAPLKSGSVSVDQTRSERRTIQATFRNEEGDLKSYPGGFWYDKVLKVFRGVRYMGSGTPAVQRSILSLDGSVGSYVSTPWTTSKVNGTLDLRAIDVTLSDWTPASRQILAAQWDDQDSVWFFGVTSDGSLEFAYSTTGEDSVIFTSSITLVSAASLANGDVVSVGVTHNPTTSEVKFFYMLPTETSWTQLGLSYTEATLVTEGGDELVTEGGDELVTEGGNFLIEITPRVESSVPLTVGARFSGTDAVERLIGTIGIVEVRDGVDGPYVARPVFTNKSPGSTTFSDLQDNIWTLHGNAVLSDDGSIPGLPRSEEMWESQVGEFTPDAIDSPNFPYETVVTGRDYTKKLLTSKFTLATLFEIGTTIEDVVRSIAINGGIDPARIITPLTGKTLGRDFMFESLTERWAAMTEIATAYKYELFFDGYGYLVMREQQDPISSPLIHTFRTGSPSGNLVRFSKRTGDARIYNSIIVSGESNETIPVWATAKNTEPSSPTRISKIGERVYGHTSPFLETTQQCQDLANQLLQIHSLEEFEVSMESVVIPWLEAGEIVEFLDPNPSPGDPTRYLFSNFTIPLDLGPMSSVAKRLQVVG